MLTLTALLPPLMLIGTTLSCAATQEGVLPSTSRHSTMRSPGDEAFRVLVDSLHLRVAVHHRLASHRGIGTGQPPVLFVHGATFPSALAAGFRFDGVSWMDDLAARGFDVWALDFLGYGYSDRYVGMRETPFANPPLGRAPEAALQILTAVRFIAARTHLPRVSIIAHSWGTVAAGLFAASDPALQWGS